MFRARRRPLLRAAMVGGGAYVAGKHRARKQDAEAEQEQYQDDPTSAVDEQQQAAPAPAPAAPAAGGGESIVDQLKQLSDLKASGALSDQEFEAAKAKLLGGA